MQARRAGGFSRPGAAGARPVGDSRRVSQLPAGGQDESGPEVFSSHGFGSQVRILAPEGKAWSRPREKALVAAAPWSLARVWPGGVWPP